MEKKNIDPVQNSQKEKRREELSKLLKDFGKGKHDLSKLGGEFYENYIGDIHSIYFGKFFN